MNYDLIILTDSRYLKDSTDPYKHNVFYEDQLVLMALQKIGLNVGRKAWDDKEMDWASTKAVLFRSTWDYFDRFPEFLRWIEHISSVTKLINSEALIHWNLDKHYLLDLTHKGTPIPETVFIEQGNAVSLDEIFNNKGWHQMILKPCVSGAGRHTYLVNESSIPDYEQLFKKLIHQESMMLQEFQKNITTKGEISLMLFNGVFTHAVLKKAKPGDFRVQDDFGGTVHDYIPKEEEIRFSQKALNSCSELPTYARVDIFYDNNDKLILGELELIEPELWFRKNPRAADIFATYLKEIINEI